MNTLSRIDFYLSSFFSFPSSSSSSSSISKPKFKRTVTPPPNSSSLSPASSTASSSSLNPNPNALQPRSLSNLPPTPRSKRRYRSSSDLRSYSSGNINGTTNGATARRRRKVVSTTYSSIKVPPPTTPLILRIALVLWSILLSFWRSLVGETRSGRIDRGSRSKRRKHINSSSSAVNELDGLGNSSVGVGVGVGVLRELGESLMVSAGISPSPNNESGGIKAQKAENASEREGSGSEIEPELDINQTETEQEDDDEDEDSEWIDPLVTRAPSDQSSLDKPPPSENDFAVATTEDQIRNNPANFTFRLKSAKEKQAILDQSISNNNNDSTAINRKNLTSFQRQPLPASILSNPIKSQIQSKLHIDKDTSDIPKIEEVDSLDQSKEKEEIKEKEKESPTRKSGILANPISTSILDPSVPAPIKKNDSSIFRNTTPNGNRPNRQGGNLLTRNSSSIPRMNLSNKSNNLTPFHLQKTLILDLDETLIHSTSRPLNNSNSLYYGNSHSGGGGILGLNFNNLINLNSSKSKGRNNGSSREGHSVEVVLNGRSTMYHVYKRPYVDHFLKKVASWYTLVIFTASMPEYADPVIDWLDSGRNLFAKRLYRESCHLQSNGSYTKDLTLVEKDLSRVCFMDNSPISYNWNKANALPIEGWTSDPNDEALLQSIPVLDSLRFVNDVRRVLGIRGFT
ncbi:uncharacterized protein L201_003619 [Kwoniella dendrophila CBS 6074]|uniref:FCP1 homology domain-containing protein n=1 Tax=Kwoniella dendrophila CBS 6074 TaxID=1295534 RepID=A0AAX4JTE9_9TREE